jgi:hypothetical protein
MSTKLTWYYFVWRMLNSHRLHGLKLVKLMPPGASTHVPTGGLGGP